MHYTIAITNKYSSSATEINGRKTSCYEPLLSDSAVSFMPFESPKFFPERTVLLLLKLSSKLVTTMELSYRNRSNICSLLSMALVAMTSALPTSYPTTLTYTTSTSISTIFVPNPAFPINGAESYIATTTITVLEPWLSKPTTFPYTLTQTAISTIKSTYIQSGDAVTQSVSSGSTTETISSTWILYKPLPTYLPAGTPSSSLPCAQCAPPEWTPEQRCRSHNLDTACQGQCLLREGLFWCYKRYYNEPGAPVMGRVCWGNNGTGGQMFQYAQLVEPCLVNDHQIQCMPCKGLESNWVAGNWLLDL